jgi:hypothetical protein
MHKASISHPQLFMQFNVNVIKRKVEILMHTLLHDVRLLFTEKRIPDHTSRACQVSVKINKTLLTRKHISELGMFGHKCS